MNFAQACLIAAGKQLRPRISIVAGDPRSQGFAEAVLNNPLSFTCQFTDADDSTIHTAEFHREADNNYICHLTHPANFWLKP